MVKNKPKRTIEPSDTIYFEASDGSDGNNNFKPEPVDPKLDIKIEKIKKLKGGRIINRPKKYYPYPNILYVGYSHLQDTRERKKDSHIFPPSISHYIIGGLPDILSPAYYNNTG
ncbi:hypothetical protein AYK24_09855 [Thermoplasmatales archaeon SG8-52-4]|nr:MAG: hypothetical protein AYK24_09855 [Thermoplasmatales archaeon SG8-52-4]